MLQNFSASQKRFSFCYTFLMVWTISMSASAELIDDGAAAVIEEINGSLNLFEVKRGKEKLSVFPLMVLRSGDELSVLKPKDTSLKKISKPISG